LKPGCRFAGGIRVTEERELYAVRAKLERYPQAVAAILQMASNLHRPVDTLFSADTPASGDDPFSRVADSQLTTYCSWNCCPSRKSFSVQQGPR
jgi:hypothetical protein